jgi:multiple sugar transport system permease protein
MATSAYLFPKPKPREQSGFRYLLSKMWRYRIAYLLILPTVIMMFIVHLLPIVQGTIMSVLDLNGAQKLRLFLNAPYSGLENYETLIFNTSDAGVKTILNAARNTVFYAIIVNMGTIGLGLVAAMLLNRRFRGQRFARTLILLPWIIPTYAVGLMWANMWLSETGIINTFLVDVLHLTEQRPFWLIGPNAFWAVVIPTIWRGLPFNTVMLLAGLQVVPDELYEAAQIDGASIWQQFYYITLPLLKPVLAIMVLWGIIFTAFGYNIVIMMFGNGGGFPGEYADLLMPAIHRATFSKFSFGIGAAASILMMAAMLVFVGIWMRTFRESFTQEGAV